jgi:uncharacterized protein YecE (DUF72 family)
MSSYKIGTSGWNYTSWKINFYPKDCPQSQWLEYYSQYFDTVELNATFYRFFKADIYQRWYNRTPEGFKYVVKVPGYITHRKQLLDATNQIQTFCKNVKVLKEKLALILLQLSPRTPYDLDRLEEKLIDFGNETKRLVIEFRNEKWLTDDTVKLLKKYHAIFCNVDSPTFQHQAIMTSKIAYLRLHGRKKMYQYFYSEKELEDIAQQVQLLKKNGAKQIYCFFNNDVNANSVNNAFMLKKILGC